MTTSSRVSDSRVTGQMAMAACEAYYQHTGQIPPTRAMRAALEAALARQGPVVKVSELRALCDEWDEGLRRVYYTEAKPLLEDLRNLISKEEKV